MTNAATRFQPDISGSAVPSGFVGEKITASLSDVTLSVSGTTYNAGSLTLTPGVWLAMAKLTTAGAGTSQTDAFISISTTSASRDTTTAVRDLTSTTSTRFQSVGPVYYSVNANTPIYLTVSAGYTGTAPVTTASTSYFFAVRIA